MYKCQLCHNNSQPRVPAHRITLTTHAVFYPAREKVNVCRKRAGDHSKFVRTNDPGGIGFECEREILVCPECAARWLAQNNGHR
jgi:hypothetical protein